MKLPSNGVRGSKRHFATKGVICWLWQGFLNWGFAYLDSISRGWFVTFRGCGRICVPWDAYPARRRRITRFHDPWAHYSATSDMDKLQGSLIRRFWMVVCSFFEEEPGTTLLKASAVPSNW